jgi:hypothetical protein
LQAKTAVFARQLPVRQTEIRRNWLSENQICRRVVFGFRMAERVEAISLQQRPACPIFTLPWEGSRTSTRREFFFGARRMPDICRRGSKNEAGSFVNGRIEVKARMSRAGT